MATRTPTIVVEESGKVMDTSRYRGPGADEPHKYIKGALSSAYELDSNDQFRPPGMVYRRACQALDVEANSHVEAAIRDSESDLLNGETISLTRTYLGEKGFLASLPLLHRNPHWAALDASAQGLRNEAVLCLVDMLLGPRYAGRSFRLNLSKNPISETAGRALLELAVAQRLESVNLQRTKVPRDLMAKLRHIVVEANSRPTLQPRPPARPPSQPPAGRGPTRLQRLLMPPGCR